MWEGWSQAMDQDGGKLTTSTWPHNCRLVVPAGLARHRYSLHSLFKVFSSLSLVRDEIFYIADDS